MPEHTELNISLILYKVNEGINIKLSVPTNKNCFRISTSYDVLLLFNPLNSILWKKKNSHVHATKS